MPPLGAFPPFSFTLGARIVDLTGAVLTAAVFTATVLVAAVLVTAVLVAAILVAAVSGAAVLVAHTRCRIVEAFKVLEAVGAAAGTKGSFFRDRDEGTGSTGGTTGGSTCGTARLVFERAVGAVVFFSPLDLGVRPCGPFEGTTEAGGVSVIETSWEADETFRGADETSSGADETSGEATERSWESAGAILGRLGLPTCSIVGAGPFARMRVDGATAPAEVPF